MPTPPIRALRPWLKPASIVVLLALLGGSIALIAKRGVYVKVVNATAQPMADVRLVLGTGRSVALDPISPGRSSGASIGHGETSDVRLVYRQPDGTINDVLRAGFGPEENATSADKIVLGVMSHRSGGDPGTMRYFIARRKRYDPAAYLPFGRGPAD